MIGIYIYLFVFLRKIKTLILTPFIEVNMQQLKAKSLIFILLLIVVACNTKPSTDSSAINSNSDIQKPISRLNPNGNYVTADYAQRNKGYDWVGINIQQLDAEKIQIKVRSRDDRKKPTCTLDAEGKKIAEGVFEVQLLNGFALLTFKNNQLTFSGKTEKDASALYFYCSGGASLAGVYGKINSELDTAQSKRPMLKK